MVGWGGETRLLFFFLLRSCLSALALIFFLWSTLTFLESSRDSTERAGRRYDGAAIGGITEGGQCKAAKRLRGLHDGVRSHPPTHISPNRWQPPGQACPGLEGLSLLHMRGGDVYEGNPNKATGTHLYVALVPRGHGSVQVAHEHEEQALA